MNKFLVAIMAFLFCAIYIKAQVWVSTDVVTPLVRPLPTKLDDFIMCTIAQEKITTELISCNATSNATHTRIDINRNYGIPRFGVILNCNLDVDTVWYIPNNYVRATSGGISSPYFTDTSLTIWWKETNFTVKIMNVLNGDVVFDETLQGQPASEFYTANGFESKNPSNLGTTIIYSGLPDGLYWIYIIDKNDIIWTMYTIRKGV